MNLRMCIECSVVQIHVQHAVRVVDRTGVWAVCADEDTDAQDLGIEDISDEKVAHLDAMLDSTQSSKSAFLKVYGVENLKSMTEDQYQRAKKQLQQKKAKQAKK